MKISALQVKHSEAFSDVGGVEDVGELEAELSSFLKQLQNLPDPRLITAFVTNKLEKTKQGLNIQNSRLCQLC